MTKKWGLTIFSECPQPGKIGDGICNDEVNNEDCNYDGGDCCGACVNRQNCSECICLGNTTGVSNALIGDGYCNDETNNIFCSFDGLDCCRYPVKTDRCTECSCHGKLKHRVEGF